MIPSLRTVSTDMGRETEIPIYLRQKLEARRIAESRRALASISLAAVLIRTRLSLPPRPPKPPPPLLAPNAPPRPRELPRNDMVLAWIGRAHLVSKQFYRVGFRLAKPYKGTLTRFDVNSNVSQLQGIKTKRAISYSSLSSN